MAPSPSPADWVQQDQLMVYLVLQCDDAGNDPQGRIEGIEVQGHL